MATADEIFPATSTPKVGNAPGVASPTLRLSSLPEVPGGWTTRVYRVNLATSAEVEPRVAEWTLEQPAQPDHLLDDPQVIEANRRDDYMPYWSSMWPAAPLMANAIADAPWEAGSRVLEIGAGIGLVGLACLARGDCVTFTDYEPTSVLLCQRNAIRNGFANPPASVLDWREPTGPKFPVIVGCEVTYEARNHPLLLNLFDQLLEPGGIVWLGDPGRYHMSSFRRLAEQHRWSVTIKGRNPESVPADFQIFELKRTFP